MDICEDKPQELNILKKKRECYDKVTIINNSNILN